MKHADKQEGRTSRPSSEIDGALFIVTGKKAKKIIIINQKEQQDKCFIPFISEAKLKVDIDKTVILKLQIFILNLQLPIKHKHNKGGRGSRSVDWLQADGGLLSRPRLAHYLLSSAPSCVTT